MHGNLQKYMISVFFFPQVNYLLNINDKYPFLTLFRVFLLLWLKSTQKITCFPWIKLPSNTKCVLLRVKPRKSTKTNRLNRWLSLGCISKEPLWILKASWTRLYLSNSTKKSLKLCNGFYFLMKVCVRSNKVNCIWRIFSFVRCISRLLEKRRWLRIPYFQTISTKFKSPLTVTKIIGSFVVAHFSHSYLIDLFFILFLF